MKVVFQEEQLNNLRKAIAVCPIRSTLPVLQCVLIDVGKEYAVFTCTNLEQSIQVVCEPSKVEAEGKALVSGHKLARLVASLSGGTVTMELKEHTLHISSGGSRFKFTTLPVVDFPEMPTVDKVPTCTMPARQFVDALQSVAVATSKDATRLILNGMLMQVNDANACVLSGTDGKRLHRNLVDVESDADMKDSATIMPAELVALLPRVLNLQHPVTIGFEGAFIQIRQDRFYCVSKALDGMFPNVNQVIPPSFKSNVDFDPKPLQNALKRLALAFDSVDACELTVNTEGLKVSAQNVESAGEEDLLFGASAYFGDTIKFALSYPLFVNAVEHLSSEPATLSWNDEFSPLQVEQDGFLAILMPMRQ
jgi:DNA polymerase-3 subunit beta